MLSLRPLTTALLHNTGVRRRADDTPPVPPQETFNLLTQNGEALLTQDGHNIVWK